MALDSRDTADIREHSYGANVLGRRAYPQLGLTNHGSQVAKRFSRFFFLLISDATNPKFWITSGLLNPH